MDNNCSKTRAGAVAGLPDDILVEILSRVPAMSICRFKSVSKAWRDLIVDPGHRKKLHQAMQGLFFNTLEKGHFSFWSMDLTSRPVPLDVQPAFSFLTESPGNYKLVLQDSCNGLILFTRHRTEPPYDTLGYIVCNPTTKQWRAVPTCSSRRRGTECTYLAFDPVVSSHFHLVLFRRTSVYKSMLVHAYSSETGTWRHNQTEEQEEQGQSEVWPNHVQLSISQYAAYINGFLHFIVWDSFVQQKVVIVDVEGKATRMFKLPDVVDDNRRCLCIYLGESQGYLHCITKQSICQERYELSIWVLEHYDAEEWLLKDTVSSIQLFGEKRPRSYMLDYVADMHQDYNVVFFLSTCEHKFIAYDMDHKKVSFFATSKRISKIKAGRYVPLFSESPVPLK